MAILKNDGIEFEKLILSKSEFIEAKVNDFEIFYKGKMFDFKSADITGEMVELLVINDTKEEGIIDLINEIFDNEDKQGNKIPGQLTQLTGMTYLVSGNDLHFMVFQTKQNYFRSHEIKLTPFYNDIASPPPKLV